MEYKIKIYRFNDLKFIFNAVNCLVLNENYDIIRLYNYVNYTINN